MTSSFSNYLRSTVGKKKLVGLTGLAFAGFLLSHMLGNLLIFVGAETYNKYSYALISNPLIYIAEVGLVLVFVTHVALTIQLTMQNRAARPEGYATRAYGDKRTSWVSRTLILSGLLLLVFTVLHIITFKYGTVYMVNYGGVEMRDLHKLVIEKFHDPIYVAWYELSLIVLGLHLSHGVSASFQSLGIFGAKNVWLRRIGIAFSLVVSLGFITQPIYSYFFGG